MMCDNFRIVCSNCSKLDIHKNMFFDMKVNLIITEGLALSLYNRFFLEKIKIEPKNNFSLNRLSNMIYTFLRHFCWSDCKNEWISYSFIPRFLIKNISSKANNYQSTRWLVKHFDQQHFLTIGAGVNGKCWKSKGVMVVGIILQARYQTYFINITFRCFVCFSYYSSNTDTVLDRKDCTLHSPYCSGS